MPNDELFVEVLAEIEQNPAAWSQDWWAERTPECGTTYCFAGHTVLAAGHTVEWHMTYNGDATAIRIETGENIEEAARRLLGIDYAQSLILFGAPTVLNKVYSVCADITGLDPQVLRDKVKDHK